MLDALGERGERESMREKVFHVVDLYKELKNRWEKDGSKPISS